MVAVVPGLWGESLYAGSADFYRAGRLPYPARLAIAVREHVTTGSDATALDLGCGPGSLTTLLAPMFAHVVAVDADREMIRVGRDEANRLGLTNIDWRHSYAEELDAELGPFDVVTLAQSFHWMDRPRVAAKIRRWLVPGGHCAHVGAATHQGAPDVTGGSHPAPPRDAMRELIRPYLGPDRRAGDKIITDDRALSGEETLFRAAGFVGPEVVSIAGGDTFERTEDQVVASVLSLSSAAPHLFGDRLGAFVDELRHLLRATSPDGLFSEQLQNIGLTLWRNESADADLRADS